MGRRLKLTEQLQDELCTLIRKACPIQVACVAAGISTSSFYRWLSVGESEENARQAAIEEGAEWVGTKQAEALTGAPVATLRKLARAGEFKAKKQRGRWLLARADLLQWAEPEGSPYLQFLEAIRQAEAEAEAHLVEFWQEAAPKDWRACRDLLARRWPERWSEKRQVDVKADVGLQAEVGGSMTHTHEIEVTQDEARGAIQRFRDFLMQEAIDAERLRMDLPELLSDGQPRTLEAITEAIGRDPEEVLKCLQDIGATKLTADTWALPRASGADDDLDQADEPVQDDKPAGGGPPVHVGPYPVPPGPGRGVPIVAVKTEFARRRDGEW